MLRWIAWRRLANALKADEQVAAYGESVLGQHQWALFRSFGKSMAGLPHGGLYVSGMPAGEVQKLLHSLANGGTIPVHLMHRHRSGDYETSQLRIGLEGELVMVYANREVPALPPNIHTEAARM